MVLLIINILSKPKIKIKIRYLAKIIGKIVLLFLCSNEAKLHYRVLDRFKVKCLVANKHKWSKKILLNYSCLQELKWWNSHLQKQDSLVKSLHETSPDTHVYSDSTDSAFGGHPGQLQIQSRFSKKQARLSINTKELLAIYYTLRSFSTHLKNKHVLHFTDSKCAYYCLKNHGSSDPLWDKITVKIFNMAKQHSFTLTPGWLNTKQNYLADRLSRVITNLNERMEITIPKHLLEVAIAHIRADFSPDIDLFGSFFNYKYNRFCSCFRDPLSYHVDTFTLDWSLFNCYCFCPFSLIGRFLKKWSKTEFKTS